MQGGWRGVPSCQTAPVVASTLILASSSPRRREILGRLADSFIVEPADVDETPRPHEPAVDYVIRLAVEKAQVVARPGTVVIGADTSVVLDGEILGKPVNRQNAADMLRRLAGRSHEVVTGVALVVADANGLTMTTSGHERSEVEVDDLSDTIIDWYVATGEADDKAGSYGLQGMGGLFADRVRGSVSNVIGLPLGCLYRLALDAGVDLLAYGASS